MQIEEFEPLFEATTHFNASRRYWLVRTQGGDFYDHYRDGGFIGIGYNQISLENITQSIKLGGDRPGELLAEVVKSKMPDYKQPNYAANQLIKFVQDIKRNDIVIIPSSGSHTITIGEIQETQLMDMSLWRYHIDPKKGQSLSNFSKRKSVKWLKEVKRGELEPLMFKLLNSHHIITDANNYANQIDNLLSDFYIKGDDAYLVLNVTTKADINARTLFEMGLTLLNVVDQFCIDNNLNASTRDVDLKTNLNSPGRIQFRTKSWVVAAIMGITTVAIVGNKLMFEFGKFKFDLSTPGLIQKIIDYQNNAQMRDMKQQILDHHMKSLQIKDPKDLVRVLESDFAGTNKSAEDTVDKESKKEGE